jgi:hypothetical protein
MDSFFFTPSPHPSPTRGEGAVGDMGQSCGIYRLLFLFSRPSGTNRSFID